MSWEKDIANRVIGRVKRLASDACALIAGKRRGAHSAPAADERTVSADGAAYKRGAHSMPPAADGASERPARSRGSRGAHTVRSRVPRVVSSRGARPARPARPALTSFSPRLAPATARGYSMAEVLATVAIILILASLVVMNVVALQANLRQKSLDAKAEIIYTAAQEQMTRIMASGRESVMAAPNKDNTESYRDPVDGSVCDYVTKHRVRYIPVGNAIPGDATPETMEPWHICYITSEELGIDGSDPANSNVSASNLLFGDGGLEDELLNGHWVIEYDCKSLTVYSVYYSEGSYNCAGTDAGYPSSNFERFNGDWRSRGLRLEADKILGAGNYVGYHGGGASSANAGTSLDPSIIISNGEKLTATISASLPMAVTADVAFLVTLTDSYGNSTKAYYCTAGESSLFQNSFGIPVYAVGDIATGACTPNATLKNTGLYYELKLTLDSLEGNGSLRFTKLYGSQSRAVTDLNPPAAVHPLVEGSDISIEVQAICERSALVGSGYTGRANKITFNSLFDDKTLFSNPSTKVSASAADGDSVAGISCGRHLQNLDEGSGLNAEYWRNTTTPVPYFTTAYQDASFDFGTNIDGDTDFKGWASTYGPSYFNGLDSSGTPCFKPIANKQLTSYTGRPSSQPDGNTGSVIAHLNIREAENASLFLCAIDQCEKLEKLSFIRLSGARIASTGDDGTAAALVAETVRDFTIDNCQVYLNPNADVTTTSNDPSPWIEGSNAAGLVGSNSAQHTLTIKNSSASTVVCGNGSIGRAAGLVCANAGSLDIQRSYADCYLKGKTTGGLVANAGGATKVSSSYAAGYLFMTDESSTAAGLVNGAESAAAGINVNSSYSAMTLQSALDSKKGSYHRTSPSGASHNKVLFLNTEVTMADGREEKLSSDVAGDAAFLSTDSSESVLRGLDNNPAFTLDAASTSVPYNLMDQGLDSYTWPTIIADNGKDLTHYGDWPAAFQSGALVYFEKYRIVDSSGKGGRYCYGFEGANVKTTLINESELENGEEQWVLKDPDDPSSDNLVKITGKGESIIVVGDGYGVVYKNRLTETIPANLLMPDAGSNRDSWDQLGTCNLGGEGSELSVRASNGTDYYIYPLDTQAFSNTPYVNSNSYYLGLDIGTADTKIDRYFFNPHFAKTVRRAGANEKPSKPSEANNTNYVFVRTGRQLNNLSRYYEKSGPADNPGTGYRSVTDQCTFSQQRDIAFTDYEWKTCGLGGKKIKSQEPIGSKSGPFQAAYNGNCYKITDVSFVTKGVCAGMFGSVAAQAHISNVVLCTDYKLVPSKDDDPTELESLKNNYYVQRTVDNDNRKDTVHMGVLAGFNAGTITNCACAGYFLSGSDGTVHAYTDSTISLGGLVGTNTGTISNCTADSPKLRLSVFEATAYAAGFAGTNTGSITNSYALGAIDIVEASGSKMTAAGFAGKNEGQISKSYCATAIASSGLDTVVCGFAPAGGGVSSCDYLNGGTYTYISRMYAFNFETNKMYCSGDPIRYDALKVSKGEAGYVSPQHSYVHSQTKTEEENDRYPYRGIVKNADKELVHYGNWQDDVVLGNLGVFYWELEEGSGNSGYHMTFLGSGEDTASETPRPVFGGGTSLCNSHDDGGVITQYGYGVYVHRGQEQDTELSWENIACGTDALQGGSSSVGLGELNVNTSLFNSAASEQLQEQMENTDTGDAEYSFFAFTTRVHEDEDAIRDYLFMREPTGVQQNGAVKLKYTSGSGKVSTYTYSISPFFANAMSLSNVSIDGDETYMPSELLVKTFDDRKVDCLAEPGFAPAEDKANEYEIRSLQQLQYINWHAREKRTDVLVDSLNYKLYPYLQYTTKTDNKVSRKEIEEAPGRSPRSWLQSHDVQNTTNWNSSGDSLFTPIAGAATSSTAYSYNAVLYAWFGGSYDGQSYTVRNVTVNTKSFYVGLFAATAGAGIKNVILRGDSAEASITRQTAADDKEGAYCIGGLVGLALNYKDDKLDRTITSCAVSGYSIVDSSMNKQGKGEVCVGGLIGIANVNLKNCSAVTNITIDPHYGTRRAGAGNYIRVGGLVGGLLDTIENCYSGGAIEVGDDVLKQVYRKSDGNKQIDWTSDEPVQAHWSCSTRVFLAGIAGSAFSSSLSNFGLSSSNDQQMKVYNSYTYMRFPTMKGTICSISMIASLADRHSLGKQPIIDNCYYLDSSADFKMELPKYYYYTKDEVNQTLEFLFAVDQEAQEGTKTQWEKMIEGDVRYLATFLGDDKGATAAVQAPTSAPTKLPYEEMACLDLDGNTNSGFIDKLNKGDSLKPTTVWAPVTAKDKNEVPIDGKYSFPSTASLDGLNYPFPTVVKQKDLTFSVSVNVHYGDWPVIGSYWGDGRATMDIFSCMDTQDGNGTAYETFDLYVDTSTYKGPYDEGTIGFLLAVSDPSVAAIDGVDYQGEDNDYKHYKVRVKALKDGFVTVNFNQDQELGAFFALHVTASWGLSAAVDANDPGTSVFDPFSNTLKIRTDANCTAKLELLAHDEGKQKYYSSSVTWVDPPTVDARGLLDCTLEKEGDRTVLSVTRMGDGPAIITVTATYTYNGQLYTRQLYINVEMPSLVGLSNAVKDENGNRTSPAEYQELTLGGAQHTGSTAKHNPLSDYTVPVNFFLYTEKKDTLLDSASNIEEIVVYDGGFSETLVNEQIGQRFYFELDSAATRSGSYAFLGGSLYYIDQQPISSTVTLVVRLQGGYSLTTHIPKANVKQATLFSLTLDKGGAGSVHFALNVASDSQRLDYVPEYDENDFKKPSTGSTVWTLEGWYDSKGDKKTKVLNANGTVACNYLDGVIEDGKFVQKGSKTLYARWTTTKSGWVPNTDSGYLKADNNKRYLLASSKTPGDTAAVFYQDGIRDTTTHGMGVYLRDEYYAIQPEGYIDASFEDSRFLWKPAGMTLGNATVVGLQNGKYSEFCLAENGSNAGRWAVLATTYVKPYNTNEAWKRVRVNRNSGGSLKMDTGNISYFPDSAYLLAQSGERPIYLYEYKDDIEVGSFCFGPELKLYNGDKKEVSLVYSGPLDKVPGADIKSSGWELIGWFNSKSKKATMILDSNGNVVGSSPLQWSDDLCLYAKWRSSGTVSKAVKIDDLNLSEWYALVDCSGSIQYNKDQTNKLAWNTVNVGNSVFVYENGSHVDALGTSDPTTWMVSGTAEGLTLSTKQSNKIFCLGWKTTDAGSVVLEATDTTTENPPQWKIVKDEETGETYLAAIDSENNICGYATFVHSNEGDKWEYVYNGTWCLVEKENARPITFYKFQNNLYYFSWDRK